MKRSSAHLLAPGPVPVPGEVQRAMSAPLVHHRTDAFREIARRVQSGLQWLYETRDWVLTLTGSGTVGMEAAVVNFADPTRTLLTIGGGKFGCRWTEIARAYGLDVVELEVEWGSPASPEALDALLDRYPSTSAVAFSACETSTGVLHPVEELCAVVRNRADVLLLVDGITSVGVSPLPMDAWGIDVLVSGSQKIFAVPPGLTCLGISARAWSLQPSPGLACYSLDLQRELQHQREAQTSFTPATSLWMGLAQSLALMQKEGREPMWSRHALHASAVRAAVKALGFGLVSKRPCNAVTAIKIPPAIDALELVANMRQRGTIIAGGQGPLRGKIVRIGHLGSLGQRDILAGLGDFELALQEQGWSAPLGAATSAALRVYHTAFTPEKGRF